ncbi:endonuclease/exonuclease/phosphatase family protein [Pseudomonas sp. RIT-PI-S]|uniref:endonuclease/exonuclease/phosphatase family protein n=1 Tax=Pseudomonas sp. RIT-PI-S TaxID=3035295 RepID=UPI0021DB48C6|nr:endonuclease/exonuclease/phosphatase family protein [Pseudomonas sp. RIT-PI-S]
MIRGLRTALLVVLLGTAALAALAWHLSWHPKPHAAVTPACRGNPPSLAPGQALKVMTWNVQFLAGKRYLFWYDAPEGRSHDDQPTPEDIAHDLDEVVRVIREEQPDLVLLQELDDGAKATGYQNQLALLQERLIDLYPCSVDAFDWKAEFVPDPHVLGSVGRKLATLSRYRIDEAERWQLPRAGSRFSLFRPQRVLLGAYLPIAGGEHLAVLNTRLEPYHHGSDAQARQLQAVAARVDRLEGLGAPWLLGGDFNLLPLGQYRRLEPSQQDHYSAADDLHLLWEHYPIIPSNAQAGGSDRAGWFTHFPASASGPDRTLDYLVHSPRLQRLEARVRQEDTLGISDHLPLMGRFLLPAGTPPR